jgi:hypothetical protein
MDLLASYGGRFLFAGRFLPRLLGLVGRNGVLRIGDVFLRLGPEAVHAVQFAGGNFVDGLGSPVFRHAGSPFRLFESDLIQGERGIDQRHDLASQVRNKN